MKVSEFLNVFLDLVRVALVIVMLFMAIPLIWNPKSLIGKEPYMIIILLIIVMLYSIKVGSLYDRIKVLTKLEGDSN